MRKAFFLIFFNCLLVAQYQTQAQGFATRGKIEFEKRVNVRKNIYGPTVSQQIDLSTEYKTTYFDYTFSNGSSIYKFNQSVRTNNPFSNWGSIENNVLFTDQSTQKTVAKKNIENNDYLFEDTIQPVKWHIEQETRMIAGYECRKAVGRIFDTLYVVAFYASELVIQGGPEGFNGLPGMILGLAIPRLSVTWFATKVDLVNVDENQIKPPDIKGKRPVRKETVDKLIKMYAGMGEKVTPSDLDVWYFKSYYLNNIL